MISEATALIHYAKLRKLIEKCALAQIKINLKPCTNNIMSAQLASAHSLYNFKRFIWEEPNKGIL